MSRSYIKLTFLTFVFSLTEWNATHAQSIFPPSPQLNEDGTISLTKDGPKFGISLPIKNEGEPVKLPGSLQGGNLGELAFNSNGCANLNGEFDSEFEAVGKDCGIFYSQEDCKGKSSVEKLVNGEIPDFGQIKSCSNQVRSGSQSNIPLNLCLILGTCIASVAFANLTFI